jgi:hypothetical protein
MPIAVGKLRVLIATTNGPVEVQLLTEEDAVIGRCVACIGGTTETADIAAAYHAFVVRPTGIVERWFGHSCYRLDLSGRIDAGSSWQLGVLAAHALLAAGRLAQEKDTADAVLWATGSVRPVDLTVGAVSHVPEKLANSLERLRQERAAGRRVLLALPAANAAEVPQTLADELSAEGFKLVTLAHVEPLFDALAMQIPDNPRKPAVINIAGGVPGLPPPVPAPAAPRRRWTFPAVAAAVLLAVAGTTGALLKYRDGPERVATTSPQSGAAPKVVAPTRVAIVPEQIPFITTQDRARVRAEYMTAPDYKALATSLVRMDFVTGQPTQEAADHAALEVCERSSGSAVKTDAVCDLYASGNIVVTRRSRPPMPPDPWVVRNPAIERPFVAAQVPLAPQGSRDRLVKDYPGAARAKAVAISPSGNWWSSAANSSWEEAVRRTLERCGYVSSMACMVIAIDDSFVVPMPTLVKVVGFFRPEGLVGVTSGGRDEIVRRLAAAPNAWNAVAVGTDGNVGLALNAGSERSAIDAALADCATRDRECRVIVLGPFLVEATNQAQGQGPPPPQAREPAPPPAPARVPLVPEQVPFISSKDQQRIRNEYMSAPDYKALAISFGQVGLVSGRPSQDEADRAAVELCKKTESSGQGETQECSLFASGNLIVASRSRPPMPAEPWVVRNRSVEQPFDAAKIPMLDASAKERIANGYARAGSKAFVMSDNKHYVSTVTPAGLDESIRRSLERCGSVASRACMVVAVDNTFVVPLPAAAKVVGFYRPEALVGVTPAVRDEVSQRLARSVNAWNAVAIGAGGNVGIATGADSEQDARDLALADCGKRDRECRITVMGPFLVDPKAPNP